MPFRLINAPASFQAYINKALSRLLDYIYVIYLNNILIYTASDDVALYWRAIYSILKALQKAELFINLKKCTFTSKEVHFLGFIITRYSMCANPT